MINFTLGTIIGGVIGLFITALCVIAAEGDDK